MGRKGILFVMSGPSGVGKGTIVDKLLARTSNISVSVSATTRGARAGEVEGTDYFFVGEDRFKEMIENDEFLEWANVYKNMYGTPRFFIDKTIGEGQDVILEIDIQGAMQVKGKRPDAVFIFIRPPDRDELERRLVTRGKDSDEMIQRRLDAYDEEMGYLKHYDYEILNDNLESAVNQAVAIVTAERCRIRHQNLR